MILELNDGFNLRSIDLTEDELKDTHTINMNYSHLYYFDKKISNNIFRKGGLGGKFKDGYCELIFYKRVNKKAKGCYFSFGEFVIINNIGNIVLKGKPLIDPHHIEGRLASVSNSIYDLQTGELIAVYDEIIKGVNSIIIKHCYKFNDKENILPLGIYTISYKTAELVKIDDVK